MGVVLAGEPALEASLKAYDERFANRMGLIYKLQGLNRKEVERYFNGYDVEPEALEEHATVIQDVSGYSTGHSIT